MADYSLGIEEEYLLVDRDTLDLAEAPAALMEACQAELQDQVSPEFLQCQIEIGTRVCASVAEAKSDLQYLRSTIKKHAEQYNLTPLAVACHPFADWHAQQPTDKDRYRNLERDLAGVARRMLICGMHIHVGIPRENLRIDLMNQLTYFLPHLLALSTSSPFWQGRNTGLSSYRLSVFDNLPRTGLPPVFNSYSEYERSVEIIIDSGLIQDSSKIWWDLRPSSKYPTLETRICDVTPRLNDTVAIAALTQCLMRMLGRLHDSNQSWRQYDRFLVGENRWRAQRYGPREGLIDLGKGTVVDYADLLDEFFELLDQDAEALGCADELHSARDILDRGTSAERQCAIFEAAADKDEGLRAVVRSLIEDFSEDL